MLITLAEWSPSTPMPSIRRERTTIGSFTTEADEPVPLRGDIIGYGGALFEVVTRVFETDAGELDSLTLLVRRAIYAPVTP